METSAEDRFGSLFTSGSKPTPHDPTKPHLFEIEQQTMQQNSPWTIPEAAQYPRQVRGPAPKPAGGDDLFTSSEDDDYVSAFSKKPTMLSSTKKNQQKPKPRRMPEATARGYAPGAHIEAKGPIKYVPTGNSANPLDDEEEDDEDGDRPLPSSDKLGNSVTGHFCQFNLVKKFPYKYMVDANDRVSRHFFANNKFFERTWDL
jgi:hypothetical protein